MQLPLVSRLKALSKKTPPARVVRAVDSVRNRVGRVHQKMVPPGIALLEMATSFWLSQAIYVAAELRVADHLQGGAKSVDQLAQLTGSRPDMLYRVLRALASHGIFFEIEDRKFEQTALSNAMSSNAPGSMRDMIRYQGGFNWAHWGELIHSVRTGETAASKVRGMSMWDFLEKNPEHSTTFNGAMTGISDLAILPILDSGYDFGAHGLIVDVGGGTGKLLASILDRYPAVSGLLYDLPHVVRDAKVPKDRCRIEGGSFLEKVPAGGDAYLMKHILHDWEESKCVQILSNIRKVIGKDAKLLVLENVVPEGNQPHFSKLLDLEMMVVVGGRERTLSGYAELFAKGGFELERVVPTATPGSILVARPI